MFPGGSKSEARTASGSSWPGTPETETKISNKIYIHYFSCGLISSAVSTRLSVGRVATGSFPHKGGFLKLNLISWPTLPTLGIMKRFSNVRAISKIPLYPTVLIDTATTKWPIRLKLWKKDPLLFFYTFLKKKNLSEMCTFKEASYTQKQDGLVFIYAIRGLHTDEEVIVFIISWCQLFCICTMQKCYTYLLRALIFWIFEY